MPNDNFYTSKEWRNLRELKLSLNPFCENPKCKNIATEVDHIKDRKTYPELELQIDNLQSMCKSCHSSKTHKGKIRSWNRYKPKYI